MKHYEDQFQTFSKTGMFYYGVKKDFQGNVDKSTFFSNPGMIINTFGYYRNDDETWVVFVTDDERGTEIKRKKLPTEEEAIEYLVELFDSQNFAHYSNTVMEHFEEKQVTIIDHLKAEYGNSAPKCTQDAISDHLGEFASAKGGKFNVEVKFDSPCSPESKASYEDFRKQIEGDSKYDNISITYPWDKEE